MTDSSPPPPPIALKRRRDGGGRGFLRGGGGREKGLTFGWGKEKWKKETTTSVDVLIQLRRLANWVATFRAIIHRAYPTLDYKPLGVETHISWVAPSPDHKKNPNSTQACHWLGFIQTDLSPLRPHHPNLSQEHWTIIPLSVFPSLIYYSKASRLKHK